MNKNIYFTIIIVILSIHFITKSEGVEVSVTTKSYNGQFAPKNAIAIWIVDLETDQYLSTIFLSTEAKTFEGDELEEYTSYSGGENDYHPVAPLRENHSAQINVVWDCITFYDQLIWDDDFAVYVEFSEESTFDPTDTNYYCKIICDTIKIDRVAGFATSTAPDTDYFSDFTITYNPDVSIKSSKYKKMNNAGLTYHYNPNSKYFIITCTDVSKNPSLLRILNLKGQVIDKVAFDSKMIQWNMNNVNGQAIPIGKYFFKIYSNTGDAIGSAYPFTIIR